MQRLAWRIRSGIALGRDYLDRLRFSLASGYVARQIWIAGWLPNGAYRLSDVIQNALAPSSRIRGSVLAIAVAAVALLYSYPTIAGPWILPEYRYRHERFSGAAVFDRGGEFLGLIPGQLDFLGDFSLGEVLPPDHKALYISEVPDVWWDVLKALEDRHLGTWRSWGGVDVLALGRAVFRDLPSGRIRGGSTLPMMLVRSMAHYSLHPHDPFREKLGRKLVELRDAPVLMRALGMQELKRWLAMHLPLASGTPGSGLGGSLYGVQVTAQILFGLAVSELNTGQQAILAAAVWRPILLASESDEAGIRLRDSRWKELKERAAKGLVDVYGQEDPRTREGLRELTELSAPQAHVSARLMPLLAPDPSRQLRLLANPFRRSLWLARGEMIQAIAELQEQYGPRWRNRVGAVHLNIDVVENVKFKRRIERELARIKRRSERVQLPLVTDRDNLTKAEVLVALAEGVDGRIVRFYANMQDTTYAGAQSKRDHAGRYRADLEDRPIGSLGKIAVSVLLGSLGDPHGQYSLCNKSFGGIRNPGGDRGVADCRQANALYRTEDVFARSLNLPLIWRLGNIPEGDLARVARAFGLTVPPADWKLRLGLPLGMVAAAPSTLHRMIQAVILGTMGHSVEAATPGLIARLTAIGRDRTLSQEFPFRDTGKIADAQAYFAAPNTREYVKRTLSAPLSARLGGTLGALEDWSEHKNPEVAIHLAKTGTTTTGNGSRDKYAVGGLVWQGRLYTYLALVGTGDPRNPLGKNLTAEELLVPLIRAALESLGG